VKNIAIETPLNQGRLVHGYGFINEKFKAVNIALFGAKIGMH
jgi:hypothetical protein